MVHLLMCKTETDTWVIRVFENQKTAEDYAEYFNANTSVYHYVISMRVVKEGEE